jgi:DNA-binding response OmpR family regulator/TolB-like protein/tetratricopeptide (TPR) repeat protein
MKTRILVAAQQATTRAALAQLLQSNGYDVELAASAKRGRHLLEEADIAVAIVAPGSLGADGLILAQDLAGSRCRVIVLAYNAKELRNWEHQLRGLDGYFRHPVDEQRLLARLAEISSPLKGNGSECAVARFLRFDGRALDLAGRTFLDAHGQDVPLTRAEFDLLASFARNPGRVLSRDQLRDLMSGRDMEPYDRSVDMLVMRLRRKIEPEPKSPCFIHTVPGVGYRFAARVQRLDVATAVTSGTTSVCQSSIADIALGDRPTIAILPFINMCGDRELEYCSDSVTEDLITAVAKLHWCLVLSRNCAFTYKDQVTDPKSVVQKHGLRYVLEGSVRPVTGGVRITARLIDGISNYHIWAETFDSDRRKFAAQHEDIVARITRGLSLSLIDAEACRRNGASGSSIDTCTLGWRLLNRSVNQANTRTAVEFFEQSVNVQSASPRALVGLALGHVRNAVNVWSREKNDDIRFAGDLVLRALSIAPDNAEAHYVKGLIYREQNEFEQSIKEYEAAINLSPSLAPAYAQIGQSWIRLGQSRKAFAFAERALRLSPRDPNRAIWLFTIGAAHLYLSQYDAAVRILGRAIQADPDYTTTYALLASAHALTGNRTVAQRALRELKRLAPNYSIETYKSFAHGENHVFGRQVQRACDGLRKAGLSES